MRMFWTLTMIDQLRALRKNGLSFSECAIVFHCSRSAIAGKCRRLGLSDPKHKNAHAGAGRRPAYSRPTLDADFEDRR